MVMRNVLTTCPLTVALAFTSTRYTVDNTVDVREAERTELKQLKGELKQLRQSTATLRNQKRVSKDATDVADIDAQLTYLSGDTVIKESRKRELEDADIKEAEELRKAIAAVDEKTRMPSVTFTAIQKLVDSKMDINAHMEGRSRAVMQALWSNRENVALFLLGHRDEHGNPDALFLEDTRMVMQKWTTLAWTQFDEQYQNIQMCMHKWAIFGVDRGLDAVIESSNKCPFGFGAWPSRIASSDDLWGHLRRAAIGQHAQIVYYMLLNDQPGDVVIEWKNVDKFLTEWKEKIPARVAVEKKMSILDMVLKANYHAGTNLAQPTADYPVAHAIFQCLERGLWYNGYDGYTGYGGRSGPKTDKSPAMTKDGKKFKKFTSMLNTGEDGTYTKRLSKEEMSGKGGNDSGLLECPYYPWYMDSVTRAKNKWSSWGFGAKK